MTSLSALSMSCKRQSSACLLYTSGRAGEERRQAAFTQAAEHQRIGIAAQIDEDDDGVDDKRHEEHRADQKQQELAVLGEDCLLYTSFCAKFTLSIKCF